MTALFTRGSSEPFSGRVERDERGRPIYRYESKCLRCGGAGGAEKWRPTGWTCYDCGGNGRGPVLSERLYTAEENAKLDAAAAKRAAKRAEKERLAEEARRAPYLAWAAERRHVLDQIYAHSRSDLVARIVADGERFVISPDWMLDSALARALRDFAVADLRAASGYVGEVGKRIELDLTCEKLLGNYAATRFDPPFYIALLRDGDGNRIVYRGGTPPLGEGDSGRFRVTVKEHGERDGEKQTVIARAREIVPEDAAPIVDQWGRACRATSRGLVPIEKETV